jgi:hypothetical protein
LQIKPGAYRIGETVTEERAWKLGGIVDRPLTYAVKGQIVEGGGRPAGITLEAAKSQTQCRQPLLPNLQRVNAAVSATGRTRFTALLYRVAVAALERAFRRQRHAASPGVDRVTMNRCEQDLAGNLQRLHANEHDRGEGGVTLC